ncbi:aldo/keto reductase [Halococcus salifodinae]|uniref:General stress protein 69 n=1 Tax=Halococcus salifodinae DSM 8989 TaxID=1227456 RepID=M0NAP3_9EURY|nr:aldo/keto reductase [Halococcus salifodinae]EMA54941.1 general stress protein 69 [Halococcus salifodinae DSM 8989]
MHYRELGDSGVEVSEVGFGAWTVGTDWWGDRSEQEGIEMLRHAFDRGVTFFDTGDVYGHGRSEELVGEALADVRDEVTLATKVGYDFYNNPQAGHGELPKEMDAEYLHTAVERSLDRLDTEYIDLLQLHNANVDEVDEDILEALDELRESGKVEAIGWALGPSIGWLAEGDAAIENEFDAIQVVFNLFEQVPGQHFIETIEELDADTSLIPRVPHSSGLLNEQVTPETELGEGDHRGFRPDEWYDTGWEKLDKLRFLEREGVPASRAGPEVPLETGGSAAGDEASGRQGTTDGSDRERTMGQATIQWLLAHDAVASVTPTFRTAADIDEWAAAPETPPLSDEEFERVAGLYERDFDIERDDGMAGFRSSVEGADLDAVGAKYAGD